MKVRNKMVNNRIAHTYSIVARDSKTGEMGVGVQSFYFSVGSAVPWGESGIGVVATQSFLNKSFGLKGLDLLKQGKSPQEALDIMLSDDKERDLRQVAILDSQGRVATHTGSKCMKHAGHKNGENFSVQANLMLSEDVWPSMAKVFEANNELPLAERIIQSLEAAENVGGDLRGKQSASLLIVRGEPIENRWDDPLLDIRVEDHKEPVKELSRLLKMWRIYDHVNKADIAFEKKDIDSGFEELNKARSLFPENITIKYEIAMQLADKNRIEEAIPLFQSIYNENENWRTFTERLRDTDLIKLKNEDWDKILSI